MTLEEKALAYDNAFDIAKKMKNGEGVDCPRDMTVYELMFPQLRESEYEKIRKELIKTIKDANSRKGIRIGDDDCAKFIGWLERRIPKFKVGDTIIAKDGTCIPNELFHIDRIEDDTYFDSESNQILVCNQDDFVLWSQKPAEWSEEDNQNFNAINNILYKMEYPSLEGLKAYYPHDKVVELRKWFFNIKNLCSRQKEEEPVAPDAYVKDVWEYLTEWVENFGRLPVCFDELESCIHNITDRLIADKKLMSPDEIKFRSVEEARKACEPDYVILRKEDYERLMGADSQPNTMYPPIASYNDWFNKDIC